MFTLEEPSPQRREFFRNVVRVVDQSLAARNAAVVQPAAQNMIQQREVEQPQQQAEQEERRRGMGLRREDEGGNW